MIYMRRLLNRSPFALAALAAIAVMLSDCGGETTVVRQIDSEAETHYDAAFSILGQSGSTPNKDSEDNPSPESVRDTSLAQAVPS